VRLGMLAAAERDLVRAARPVMEELAAATGETVVLSVAAGEEAVDVAQVDSRFLVGGKRWIGLRSPLHATSDGKVLLAFGAAELPPGKLVRMSPQTVASHRALEQELEAVRAKGWARSVGEYEQGLNGVAAPIFDDGRCVAALSVSGPTYRVTEALLPDLAARCIEAADAIGWSRDAA
jgi:DNA-binding IclR family transcriptional regulator